MFHVFRTKHRGIIVDALSRITITNNTQFATSTKCVSCMWVVGYGRVGFVVCTNTCVHFHISRCLGILNQHFVFFPFFVSVLLFSFFLCRSLSLRFQKHSPCLHCSNVPSLFNLITLVKLLAAASSFSAIQTHKIHCIIYSRSLAQLYFALDYVS